ncbi:TIGR04282 family arsenosugar biosynthesis glycosyltransferase [bacterium]|nr:TIGR04282 family arsenosugar biosynthesis glycosyltransferase [bacterium]
MKKALITFVKAPIDGLVKTRLQADLPKGRAVNIYKSFIKDSASQCLQLKGVSRLLGCAPDSSHPFLKNIAKTYDFEMFDQRGRTLGDKIVNAFEDHFKKNYEAVVLIGSDSPTIPLEYIKLAYKELKEHEFVVGPCCDGGIYMIAARGEINSRIFSNIPWDSSDVLNLVMEKLYRYKINFSLLPFWYDIDNIDDLKFYKLHKKYLQNRTQK